MKCFFRRLLPLVLLGSTTGFAASKEKWLKIQTRHFTVLTSGSEASARKWATELEQFVTGLSRILPAEDDRLRPVTVLLFNSDWAMRPFKPLEKGKPKDLAGLFVELQDSRVIALALDYDPDQLRRIVYHEAVHWYANAADKSLAPWLDEGLAEVYSTFRMNVEGRYEFGNAIREHLALMQRAKLMPLDQLTTVSRGSLEYNDGNRATLFYAESWAFVHYLLFGEDTPGMDSIVRYVGAAETAPTMREAFESAFGVNYAEMQRRLEKYVRGGR